MEQPLSSNAQKFSSHSKSMLIIGSLVLLISLALLHFWLQVFFLFAIEIPVNGIGMSNLCSWQYSLSNDFVWREGSTYIPLLVLFHMMAFLFIFRLRGKKQPSILLLEFGVLNILFVVVGTGVFILIALLNIVVLIIPGNAAWMITLLGCEPTDLVLPGIITTSLMTIGLVYSQATGWLSLAPATKLNDEVVIKKDMANRGFIISGGILLLLLTLVLLHSWFVLFFTYAIQLPESGIWACWGTGCERAVWQPALSQYFAFSPGARIKPFLFVLHIALIISFFRFRHKEGRVFLPFEIGILAILFMLIGTIVFAGAIAGYKMANSPNHTIAPVSVGEVGIIVSMPALPQHDFVAKDDTGFIDMPPEDDLHYIYSKIPWEVNGRLRAWSGVVASTIVALGLLLSMISGWLNRLIRRLSPRFQINLLLLMVLISGIGVFVELYIFGFYLFW
ncbi:MAG: hypothetical protein MUO77_00120 [Anaerolineales bacterium]|nr:hypothetical protein [Anaerolineales bacterium]